MDVESALTYYRHVKTRIGHSETLWSEFKDILKSCRSERIEPHAILVRIAKLFQNYPELISGFQAFLPDCYKQQLKTDYEIFKDATDSSSSELTIKNQSPLEVTYEDFIEDESIPPVAAYGSFEELHFFEKVRNAMGHEQVYFNFLHCLELYIDDHLTKSELVKAVTPFLIKYPDLIREFKQILEIDANEFVSHKIACSVKEDEDIALDIDYCSGKRLNASYRPLPKSHPQPICSGRTQMCKEVLNDTWVSFPAWSEDSTFGASSKTKYEETMYRIEDERFELDMAIQTNAYAIEVLNNVQKRINKMTEEEKSEFVLDDYLGGTSSVLNYRFIHRIYGNRTKELMEGLKRNPVVAVPIVLNRLRVREREWKEVQERYNSTWSEQISRIYLKSLDHQGLNFKQNDAKNLRPKTLINEIETFYEEKKKILLEGSVGNVIKPHVATYFKDLNVFTDALNLILRDIKRQPGIYKEDQRHISDLLCYFVVGFFNVLPDLMNSCKIGKIKPRNIMESDSDEEISAENSVSDNEEMAPESEEEDSSDEAKKESQSEAERKLNIRMSERFTGNYQFWKDEECYVPYSLFYVNNNWYIFFRLFSTLVDRLATLYLCSLNLMENVKTEPGALELMDDKPMPYSTLLGKMCHLLTGKLESSKFEDEMRELFGVQAYISYTLDKVVHCIVKQLHIISTDDVSKQCMAYHTSHIFAFKNVTCPWMLSDIEMKYKKKMVSAVIDENCYKVVWYKKKKMLAIELLDPVQDTAMCFDMGFDNYLDKFVQKEALIKDMPFSAYPQLPVIHPRVLKKQHRFWANVLKKEMDTYSKRVSRPKFSLNGFIIQEKGLKRKQECEDNATASISKRSKLSTPSDEASCSFSLSESSETMKESTKCARDKDMCDDSSKKEMSTNLADDQQDGYSVVATDEIIEDLSMSIDELDETEKSNEPLDSEKRNDNKDNGQDLDSKIPEDTETAANEEDEDSINVSAEDLLFHLSQTGMGMFDCFPGSHTTTDTKDIPHQSVGSTEISRMHNDDDHDYSAGFPSKNPSSAQKDIKQCQKKSQYEKGNSSIDSENESSGNESSPSDQKGSKDSENSTSPSSGSESSSSEIDGNEDEENKNADNVVEKEEEDDEEKNENDVEEDKENYVEEEEERNYNDEENYDDDDDNKENIYYGNENVNDEEDNVNDEEDNANDEDENVNDEEENENIDEENENDDEEENEIGKDDEEGNEIEKDDEAENEMEKDDEEENEMEKDDEEQNEMEKDDEENEMENDDEEESDNENENDEENGNDEEKENENDEEKENEKDEEKENENDEKKENESDDVEVGENGGEKDENDCEQEEEDDEEEEEDAEEREEDDDEDEEKEDDNEEKEDDNEENENDEEEDMKDEEQEANNKERETSLSNKKERKITKMAKAASGEEACLDILEEEMDVDQKEDTSEDSDAVSQDGSDEPLEYCPTLFPECYITGPVQDYLNMACKEMVIVDNPVHIFDEGSQKLRFTATFRDFIYRKRSLQKARKSHQKISMCKSDIFNTWHRSWLQENVSTAMMKSCHDWLLRSDPEKYRVDCRTMNDRTKPPYGPYSKYRVRRYKRS